MLDKHPPDDSARPAGCSLACVFRWLALFVLKLVLWVLLAVALAWASGALWFDFPVGRLRLPLALVLLGTAVWAAIRVKPWWRAQVVVALLWCMVVAWWFTLRPRQDRDWKPEVAVTPHATIDGEIVTLHHVRNFDYRSEHDFTPAREVRRVDLRQLRGVDLFVCYWGSPHMAHPILSFDFGDGGRICFSIETRPERGEAYSAVGGLYRQFELACVVADERDVIRVRTNHRKGEDVYLYRLNAPRAREGFIEYLHTINSLHAKPRWYNAVSNNCTTAIRNQRNAGERAPWDWRMLVNGYGDRMLYEHGAIDASVPFDELKRRAHINAAAQAADRDPDFSNKIRAAAAMR